MDSSHTQHNIPVPPGGRHAYRKVCKYAGARLLIFFFVSLRPAPAGGGLNRAALRAAPIFICTCRAKKKMRMSDQKGDKFYFFLSGKQSLCPDFLMEQASIYINSAIRRRELLRRVNPKTKKVRPRAANGFYYE